LGKENFLKNISLKSALRSASFVATAAAVFATTAWVLDAQQGAAAPQIQQEGSIAPQAPAGRGRGRNAGPVLPTPRFADGTVNFGRVPGEKGIWNLPYITNMGMRVVTPGGGLIPEIVAAQQAQQAAAAAARAGGAGARGGGGGGGRGGAKTEPWIPFQPWAAAVYDYNSKNESKYDPEGFCLPPGGPRMFATPYPGEILQLPDQKRVVMIFEGGGHIWRDIYMDGRPHPTGDELNPTYIGHSVGHYEGDALVVDVVGFNENSWLDYFGHPHTEKMHVVERFTRPNKNTLHYEALIDDPGAYTKPFSVAWDIPWNATSELSEYICQENNKYLNRLEDDFGQTVFGPHKQPGTLAAPKAAVPAAKPPVRGTAGAKP
jgi:hypothetical protein